MMTTNKNPKITFVCCIEYGALENQTLLMVKSFRQNAGNLRDARILAVQPRFGAKLNIDTVNTLKELSVDLIIDYKNNPFTWFNYANKVAAVKIAQSLATTDLIAWLDSDTFIANEPSELILTDDIDFAARCEYLPPAVHSNNTEHIPYWVAICELFEIDFSQLPDLECDHQHIQMKMYFNSGVFVWRRQTNFCDQYYNAFVKLMDSKIAQHKGDFFIADQITLAPVLMISGLRWHHLAYKTHHMTFQSQIDGSLASPNMKDSAIIHYSKSLSEPYISNMLIRIKAELPHIYASFADELSSIYVLPFQAKSILAKLLRIYRGLGWKLFALKVKPVKQG